MIGTLSFCCICLVLMLVGYLLPELRIRFGRGSMRTSYRNPGLCVN
jgi:hypothetical protein